MIKGSKKALYSSISALLAFVEWTVAIRFIDVHAIGPKESSVGFATLNQFIHECTGVNMSMYTLTDWLGLVPIAFALGFAILGLIEWIKRRNISRVDPDILFLGGFYIAVIASYFFFERCVVNYRPVLISGYLEASYPSSTTILTLCVMITAVMQFNTRIKIRVIRISVNASILLFTAFMVIGRLLSGVHWFTDIVGGGMLSAGLILAYYYFTTLPICTNITKM